MTQENRTPVHVDITPSERVSAGKDIKITSTTWNPANGALEARLAAEEAARQQWQQEQAVFAQDPTQQHLLKLEDAVKELTGKLIGLSKQVKTLEDK